MDDSFLARCAPRPVYEDVRDKESGEVLERKIARYAVTHEHGITATHRKNKEEQSIDYIIKRPDGEKVIQIYDKKGLLRMLDSHKAKLARVGKSGYSHANYFQGRLGEIVMHIILREFFDRLDAKEERFSYHSVREHPGRAITKNENYTLLAGRNSNFLVYQRGVDRSLGPIGEFDGLYEINECGKRGMVICEAKTTKVSISTRMAKGQKSPTHIEKVMEPVQSMFPDHRIFYLLMATRGRIVSNKYNYLNPDMAQKAEDIMAAGVTPIFMPYCESAGEFESMGRFVQESLADLVGIDIPHMREVTINLDGGKVGIGSSPKGMELEFRYRGNQWRLFGQDTNGRWYEMRKTKNGFRLSGKPKK